MKALTLIEPWATLIKLGLKRYETRSWYTSYRGKLAIHAGKNKKEVKALRAELKHYQSGRYTCGNGSLADYWFQRRIGGLPMGEGDASALDLDRIVYGAVICTVDLVDCIKMTPRSMSGISREEYAYGYWSEGRFAWKLENVQVLPTPIPAKGALGLWEWELAS